MTDQFSDSGSSGMKMLDVMSMVQDSTKLLIEQEGGVAVKAVTVHVVYEAPEDQHFDYATSIHPNSKATSAQHLLMLAGSLEQSAQQLRIEAGNG